MNRVKLNGCIGCPGTTLVERSRNAMPQPSGGCAMRSAADFGEAVPMHWPIKIRLLPAASPFLKGADILMAADCAAAASVSFHSCYVPGKVLLLGCPKIDNADDYLPKLSEIFKKSGIRSCTVLRMDVPCCRGFSLAVDEAARLSFSRVPVQHIILSRSGREIAKTLGGSERV